MNTPMMARGTGGGEESGDRTRAWICIIGALLIIPTVIFMQQFARYMGGHTVAAVPRAILEDETPYDPGVAILTTESKIALKMLYIDLLDDEGGYSHQGADEWDREYVGAIVEDLESIAQTRAERLRVAIVAGDVLGAEAAGARLERLCLEVVPGGPLETEIRWLQKLYTEGVDALPDSARRSLVERHGWFGRLALVHGQHNLTEERQALINGGEAIILFQIGWWGWSGLTFLLGIVALIVIITKLVNGDITPISRVTPGSLVLLETFGMFLVGLLLAVSLTFVAVLSSSRGASAGAFAAGEVMMWLAAAALFWPLVQPGVRWTWERYRKDIGLHRGRGVWREVGAGVTVWLAELPLLAILGIIFGIINALAAGDDLSEITGGYPAFDFPFGNSWLVVLIGLLGACVWAPVFEEIAYRGVLWRLLRSRAGAAGTILITALIFGITHPYGWQGIVQVTMGGVIFGLVREWRGSLIAPMVSHCLHNVSVSIFPLILLLIMG